MDSSRGEKTLNTKRTHTRSHARKGVLKSSDGRD